MFMQICFLRACWGQQVVVIVIQHAAASLYEPPLTRATQKPAAPVQVHVTTALTVGSSVVFVLETGRLWPFFI